MKDRRSSWLERFLEDAKTLTKYDVGITSERLARRLGVDPSEILKLNSNENLFIPLDFLRGLLKEVVEEVDPRFYPRDERVELEEELARCLKVHRDQIVLGSGSDQLIELLTYAFLDRGEKALSITPTFSIYERAVRTRGAHYVPVPLMEDFSLNVERMLRLAEAEEVKVLFICSPNNPTANQFRLEDVKGLIEGFDWLVVLDETYADFATYSMVDLTREYENLVVLRTFSKVFGIAGLRLGYAVSNVDVSSALRERFQMPYPVSSVTLRMGLKLLRNLDLIKEKIESLKEERAALIRRLNEMEGVQPFNSETNFVLMNLTEMSSDEAYRRLLDQGIIVRNIGRVLNLENCIRVTVAPHPIMERFLKAFRRIIGR